MSVLIQMYIHRAIGAMWWYRRDDTTLPLTARELYVLCRLAEVALVEHPDLLNQIEKDLENIDK